MRLLTVLLGSYIRTLDIDNQVNFLGFSAKPGPEVITSPESAKVFGSIPGSSVFFQSQNIQFQRNFLPNDCLIMLCQLTLRIRNFSCYTKYLNHYIRKH